MLSCNNFKQVQMILIFIMCTFVVILVFTKNFTSMKGMYRYAKKYTSGKENKNNTYFEAVRTFNSNSISAEWKIGILIPSCTRTIKMPSLANLTLINICLPSIYRYMETKYNYIIYVGTEKGDYLETIKDNLETMFKRIKVVITNSGTFTKSVNAIAREAYRDGMDYLVRINDDTTFETINWTSKGIQVLRQYSPPNVGVVGPNCLEGNTAILTHDMVHRTHLEIFDFYYPPYFDNWWTDDWITKVYQPDRSTKLQTWLVKHHVSLHNTRYKVDFKQRVRLDKTLMFDKERLSKYLANQLESNHSFDIS